jgi:hypothetical protein
MLAESMAFGNIDGYFNRPADQPCLDGKHLSCCAVAVPSTIFQEDAVEPKTGIKFPAFLEDEASPATAVYPSCFLGASYVIVQTSQQTMQS